MKTSCFASRPALPGHRWILSDFLLNARRSRPVVFPLRHVALDLGGDRRRVWVQRGAGVRLLQARGAPPAAAQEFQAPLFQEADVHLVAGFLRGVREERGVRTLSQCKAPASPRPREGLALGRLTEELTDSWRERGLSSVRVFAGMVCRGRKRASRMLSTRQCGLWFWGPAGAQAFSHWGHLAGRGRGPP